MLKGFEGFATEREARAEVSGWNGYRIEVIDLGAPFGGPAVGSGYAALARNGHHSGAALGSYDVSLVLPDYRYDDHDEIARLLGVG